MSTRTTQNNPLPPHVARARNSLAIKFEAVSIKEWPTACELHGSDPQHHKEYAVLLRVLFNRTPDSSRINLTRIPTQFFELSITTGSAVIEENYPRLSGRTRTTGHIIAELNPALHGISFGRLGWNKDTSYELHIEDHIDDVASKICWTYSLNRPAFIPDSLPLFLVLKHPIDETQLNITMQMEKLHKYESRWKMVVPVFKSGQLLLTSSSHMICVQQKAGASLAQQVHDTQDISDRDKIYPWYPWFPTQV